MERDNHLHRRRIEHARNPNTDTTPQVADARTAGKTLFEQHLAQTALTRLKTIAPALTLDLTASTNHLKTFGAQLSQRVDLDAVPTRLKLHQQLQAESDGTADDLVMPEVGQKHRELLVDTLSDDELRHIARTAIEE